MRVDAGCKQSERRKVIDDESNAYAAVKRRKSARQTICESDVAVVVDDFAEDRDIERVRFMHHECAAMYDVIAALPFLFSEQFGNFLAAFADIAEDLKIFYVIDGDKAVVFRPRLFELRTFPIIRKECVADGIAEGGFKPI